ncbi:MAG: PTS sugar transporter subunit IIB [Deltaproteobacteria bacterium]
MIALVRVDDRLLHGQVLAAWVPFTKADMLVVASDEAASDSVLKGAIESEADGEGLRVVVESVRDVAKDTAAGAFEKNRAMFIVNCLKDAMRLYEEGFKFASLNIGNIHHKTNGRVVTRSVILDDEDERVIERFEGMGVNIDIRDIPTKPAVPYARRAG